MRASSAANRLADWETPLAAARAARQFGDAEAARTHLAEARSASDVAGGALPVDLFEAELLCDAERWDEARALLAPLLDTYPDDPWLRLRLANLARSRGAMDEARGLIEEARALDPGRTIARLHVLYADLLIEADRAAEAEAELAQIVLQHPDDPRLYLKLAEVAQGRGDLDQALKHLARGRELDPKYRTPGLALLSFDLLRAAERTAEAEAELVRAIASEPHNAELLDRLITHYACEAGESELDSVIAHVRDRGHGVLADRLAGSALFPRKRFGQALAWMRGQSNRRETEAAAHHIAAALLGAHRPRTAMRYARLALRRWPDSARIADTCVKAGLAVGDLSAVGHAIARLEGHIDPHSIDRHRFLLAAHRNQVWEALDLYGKLEQAGRLDSGVTDMLCTLVYTRLHPSDLPKLRRRTGLSVAALAGATRAHLSLAGQQMTELGLEFQALSGRKDRPDPAAWVRARPGSTVAAAWYLAGRDRLAEPPKAGGPEVPRRIVQYWWDTGAPPDDVLDLLGSWEDVPGTTYERLAGGDAIPYLLEHLGTEWARAYRLTESPAQQSSFLRLCILAEGGGIFADTDTRLVGRLDRLLRGGGLVVATEPVGGAIDNTFIAAPPRHPAIVFAARQARQALLGRQKEAMWNQTGPGLLTRATAQFVSHGKERFPEAGLVIHGWQDVAPEILTGLPASYKSWHRYWNMPPPPISGIWGKLTGMLENGA